MQKYQNNVQTLDGRAIVGASVTVTEFPGGSPATVYNSNGSGVITQPILTNGDGEFQFYAANGRYQLQVTGGGISVAQTITDIVLFDPADGTPSTDVDFIQAGSGSVTRTVQEKERDIVSVRDYIDTAVDGVTSNQAGIMAAVAHSISVDADLYWPPGIYVSNDTIPGIHSVYNYGPGLLSRDGQTFAFNPGSSDNLNLFVSPSGNDANDGITASKPFATLQAACDVIQKFRNDNGRWIVNLEAGTYTSGCALTNIRQKDRRVRFLGPTVALNSIPLAIIDGATAPQEFGFNFDNCGDIEISDVKCINFDNDLESSAGVLAANTRLLRLTNYHASNCGIGFSARSFTFYFRTGGIIDNCRYGVLELFNVVRNYETVGSLADGSKILSCVYGLFAKEFCTGHLDWTTIDDCTYGIYFSRNCTANASDSKITNCDFGVNLRNASFIVPNRIDWGFGTADANTMPWAKDGYSNFVTNEGTTQAGGPLGQGEATLATYVPLDAVAHTGTTAATTLTQLGEVQIGSLVQIGTYARAVVLGRKSGSAGTVTLELRMGSVAGATAVIPATATTFKVEFWIISRGANLQLAFATVTADVNQPASTGRNLRTVNIETLGANLSVRATLGSAADSLFLDAAFSYTTDVVGPVEPSAA